MKATGIIRRIDDLGRVVIPKEVRRNLGLKEGAPLEIYISPDNEIILKPCVEPTLEMSEVIEHFKKLNEEEKKAFVKQLVEEM